MIVSPAIADAAVFDRLTAPGGVGSEQHLGALVRAGRAESAAARLAVGGDMGGRADDEPGGDHAETYANAGAVLAPTEGPRVWIDPGVRTER